MYNFHKTCCLLIEFVIFAQDEYKLNYHRLEIGHKSSTLKKIFGSCAAMVGLIEQGSSPVQTAKIVKLKLQEIEAFF